MKTTVVTRMFTMLMAFLFLLSAFPITGYAAEENSKNRMEELAPEVREYLQPGENVADILTGDGWLYVMTIDPEGGRIVRLFDSVDNKWELMSSNGTDEPAQEILNDLETGIYILDAERADNRFYVLTGDMNDRWQIRIYSYNDEKWLLETKSSWLEKMFGVFPDFYSQGLSEKKLVINFIDEATACFIQLPSGQWTLSQWYTQHETIISYYPDVMFIEYEQIVYGRTDERNIRICGAYAEAQKIENITTKMMPQSLKNVDLSPQTGEYDAIVASEFNEYIDMYSECGDRMYDHYSFTLYQGTPVKVLGEDESGYITQIAVNGLTGYVWSEDVYPSSSGILFEVDMNPTRERSITSDASLLKQMTVYSEPSASSTAIWSGSEGSCTNLNIQVIGESKDWFAVLTTLGTGFVEKKYFAEGNG